MTLNVGSWQPPPLRALPRPFARHPVSLNRQRAGWIAWSALVLGWAAYLFTTRDAAIKQRVIDALSEATGGEVRVGSAHFRMFDGISLTDVRVAVPYNKELDPQASDARSRELFSAKLVRLVHDPWRLLLGRLKIDRIIAAKPTITLVQNVDTGLRNWHFIARPIRGDPQARRAAQMTIVIRAARAVVVSLSKDGRRESRIEELDADVRPHPAIPTAYCIEVRRLSEPAERSTVIFDPSLMMVRNTPFVDARTIRLQLPKAAQTLFDQIELEGEVKLDRLEYGPDAGEAPDTEIQLRKVRCAIPSSMFRSRLPARALPPSTDEGAVRVTHLQGRLMLRDRRLEVDVAGRVNGALCSLQGAMQEVGGSLAQAGLDLRLSGKAIDLPEGAVRRRIISDPSVPWTIRSILEDYDPHGRFDIELSMHRPAGPLGALAVTGVLNARGVRGSYRWFPYALEQVEGTIRFEPDAVIVEGLTGRHGHAPVRIDARIDPRDYWAAVQVSIEAEGVPLDANLYAALPDAYKATWNRFSPGGTARLSVQMRRPSARKGDPDPLWTSRIAADLVDASANFNEYPYPLEDVEGRIVVEPQRIEFVGVSGRHERAVVTVDGSADWSSPHGMKVELTLDARGMRLDDTLLGALPSEGRAAIAQFQPDGSLDLSGRVTLDEADGLGLQYDLRANVSEASLRYEAFPYPIRNVVGEIEFRPEHISIMNLSGRHGAVGVVAKGLISGSGDGYRADVELDFQRVQLDDELYDAMPAPLKSVWNWLQPRGEVSVQLAVHHQAQGDRLVARHRTTVEVHDASIRMAALPLDIRHLHGRVNVTDDRVELCDLRGAAQGGTVELSGQIELSAPGQRGVLGIDARGLTLNDEFFSALPVGLRTAFQSMNPKGRIDLRLDPLRFDANDDGATDWAFAGELGLHRASADVGFPVTDATGKAVFHGSVDRNAAVALSAELVLDRATLAGWRFEQLKARLDKPADQALVRIDDAVATAYDGIIAGGGCVRAVEGRNDYELSLCARDISLGRYLAAARDPVLDAQAQDAARITGTEAATPAAARGLIHGNLILRGATGPDAYREGAGEIRVKEAQVWKLPLIFAIFQVLNFTPDENVFHDGWIEFGFSHDTLTFTRIDLLGPAVSLVGSGQMHFGDRQLDVWLMARSPFRLRVPLLTRFLEGASKELMEVHLTGTLPSPNIRPQPLPSVGRALQLLWRDMPRGAG